MALVSVDKSVTTPNPNKVQKSKNYVKINKHANVFDQVVVASHNATSASTTF